MKISWKWLQQWADLSELSVDDVSHRLTMAGLEVDGVEHLGEGCDDIVVARIDRISEHPDADKLVICDLTIGDDKTSNVVCGAKNMVEGDFVALAQPGSSPPGVDFDIVSRKVRGVLSHGMLCSGSELGLEDDTDGILILERTHELGMPAFEAMGLKDTVIEVDLTPNRPDCLGHLGVARELSALYARALKTPADWQETPVWETSDAPKASDAAPLIVEDAEGCPRYLFAVIEDVKVGPSPAWLRSRLTAIGLRSINNIVDITNYILMELNQPLHVFDLDKLQGPEIRVRRATAGETIVGIDHNEYKLDPSDLVIADAERPVAIAGVMGGADTEVDETTTRVLIECAYFEPTTVRKSARRHSLHTDSSHRFERGIDPAGLPAALARAVRLMLRTQETLDSNPTVRTGIVEHCVDAITKKTQVTLPKTMPSRILGIDPSEDTIVGYLEALGVEMAAQGEAAWLCTVPTYRPDIERPIDLVEEVARMYGYDEIPSTLPRSSMGYTHRVRPEDTRHPETIISRNYRRILATIRTQLLSFGLYEVVNYGFMSAQELDLLRIAPGDRRRDTARLANPLVADDAFMQTTMLPGLLKNLTLNRARRRKNVAIFETGRRYFKDTERPTLAMLLSGQKEHHWSGNTAWDFFDLKGIVEAICRPFATEGLEWQVPADAQPYLHPGVQAEWVLDGKIIASLGRLHPMVASDLDVDAEVFVAELYLDELFALKPVERRFSAPPRFPAVTRDFALTYGLETPYADLERAITRLASQDPEFGAIFESFELFDVYAGEQVAEGMRSLALSVVYRAADKTLTDNLVERADKRLIEWLETQVQATLRG